MNTLIVSDVFEAYYDGRKGAFTIEGTKAADAQKRAEPRRTEAANKDRPATHAA